MGSKKLKIAQINTERKERSILQNRSQRRIGDHYQRMPETRTYGEDELEFNPRSSVKNDERDAIGRQCRLSLNVNQKKLEHFKL